MPHVPRWQGQAPRASLLHPVWEPTTGQPSPEAFIARSLLGPGLVGASGRLSMLDLRVWAALCALLREKLPSPPSEDPDLDRASTRTVETTGYQLAEMVYSVEGGIQWQRLRASMVRLAGRHVCVQVIERDPELAAQRIREGYVPLIGEIWLATTRLNLRTPRQWGALKGSTSLKVEIGRWTAQQVVAGRCTWLDLDLLRALGTGLAARLWAALEAWARWPQRSLDGREECAIGLGQPALESLGVGRYSKPRQARAALNRAGQQLIDIDPAYELVRCERRGGGWCLVVRRVCGARARGEARKHGRRRDRRPARLVVREIIRKSLDDAGAGKFAA
jgi:hypothetical protein